MPTVPQAQHQHALARCEDATRRLAECETALRIAEDGVVNAKKARDFKYPKPLLPNDIAHHRAAVVTAEEDHKLARADVIRAKTAFANAQASVQEIARLSLCISLKDMVKTLTHHESQAALYRERLTSLATVMKPGKHVPVPDMLEPLPLDIEAARKIVEDHMRNPTLTIGLHT